MKKIILTVALVAATVGANAQSVNGDVTEQCVVNKVSASQSDGFTNSLLDENYSFVELENMLYYTLDNILAKHPKDMIANTYKTICKCGEFRDRSLIESYLITLYNYYPNAVKQAKTRVDAESIWDF